MLTPKEAWPKGPQPHAAEPRKWFEVHRMGLEGWGWGLQKCSTSPDTFLQHAAAAACSTMGRGDAANYFG